VAPLQRAVALAEVDRVALAVAEHLELDVPRVAEVLLEIDGVVAERGLGLVARLAHQRLELLGPGADLHPAPAAARGGLDDHRIADLLGDPFGLEVSETAPSEPGTSGRPSLPAVRLASTLSPIVRMCSGLGPDPDDVVRLDDLGELGVLREESRSPGGSRRRPRSRRPR
jgi:hypothetical protein